MAGDFSGIDVLRSARRMEIKSKSVFCGGFYREMPAAVLGGSASVPDPHFNRISFLKTESVDGALIKECTSQMEEGTPVFIDVPHPVPASVFDLLVQNGFNFTGESRASMLLMDETDIGRETNALEIELVSNATLNIFLDLFLKGFDTPGHIIPLAVEMFRALVSENCGPENSRLYLGRFRGEPVSTLYLFFEGEEGGVNMVSTRADVRGKGLATAMVARAVADARSLGVRLLSLETRWGGAPERLYAKLGFSTIARHEVFTNVPDLKYGL